ncbi:MULTISPECIES: acyl-CoA synthetase [Rhodococcus]|jgi:long-chain acyl-CoA synthetase|uniref:Acyl-CoA synthetase n=1 Tax=Rhodococcus erythropolis TaxID=1833 RepID=A0A8I1D6Z0_RHOER|nr:MULTISPECIES: acyl-CoA synthetase [Rhodococcus]MCD2154252.1 acyl-CoA synthetase [Rhodococcus cerastii]MBF7735394.1 acyl-CoA synthetase [Rhodococcus erythropolis]MBH5143521.1 acyl-CoA synthetase [Rhodococcus erythropolis]MCW2299062.1 fatty-acyl-CoA synthase [Rhodococcus erythropolis]MCZ4642452.1 acyl-CoA synthetase [Rhodococcus erythropolis]
MYPGAYVATNPDKAAVIVAETGEAVTFAQLESNSIRIARVLHGLGLRRGDNLAVLATNNVQVFDIYWAAMRSGVYLTMVNWHLTAPEGAYIVEDCEAKVVIVDAALGELAETLSDLVPRQVTRLSFGGQLDGYDSLDQAADMESDIPLPDQPRGADMLYSSGTTGRPKGIKPALPNRRIQDPGDQMTTMNQSVWGVTEDDIYLSPAPLYHAAPLRTCASVQALGGTVVMMNRFDPEKALEYIERYRVTYSQWVPTMFVRMLKLPQETRDRYDISSLRLAVHAAAPCPVDVKRKMIDWWGTILDEYYSSTELNGMTIVHSDEWLRKPGTVGRAALGVLHVCGENGEDLPSGEVGTLYFERDELPFNYHNAPEKTQEAQHPAHPTWTTTGDVGFMDEEGYLFLTDRKSFMIISGGVNIYPQEIENVLIEHSSVLDAAVIGLPDDEMGEIVMAVVEPVPEAEAGDALRDELLSHLRGQIAKYKLPRRLVFSTDLPRTPTGKLVKGKLRERYSGKVSVG